MVLKACVGIKPGTFLQGITHWLFFQRDFKGGLCTFIPCESSVTVTTLPCLISLDTPKLLEHEASIRVQCISINNECVFTTFPTSQSGGLGWKWCRGKSLWSMLTKSVRFRRCCSFFLCYLLRLAIFFLNHVCWEKTALRVFQENSDKYFLIMIS